jgi:hypothetical protein
LKRWLETLEERNRKARSGLLPVECARLFDEHPSRGRGAWVPLSSPKASMGAPVGGRVFLGFACASFWGAINRKAVSPLPGLLRFPIEALRGGLISVESRTRLRLNGFLTATQRVLTWDQIR